MKKIITLTVLLVTAVTLTGCGKNKTLECTVTAETAKDLILADKQTAIMTFKDNQLSKASIEMTIEAESKEEAEEYKKQFEQLMEMDKSDSKMEYKMKIDGTNLVVSSEIADIDKMDADERKEEFGEDTSYDGLKKYFEDQGYSCK